jgi:hypothetical protein
MILIYFWLSLIKIMLIYIFIIFLFWIIKNLANINLKLHRTIKIKDKNISELNILVNKQQYYYYKEVKICNNLKKDIYKKTKDLLNDINDI